MNDRSLSLLRERPGLWQRVLRLVLIAVITGVIFSFGVAIMAIATT